MNTTEFIQAVENRKVLTNDRGEIIVKDDDGKIWFFGFGAAAHAEIVEPSPKINNNVVFSTHIKILDAKIPFPIFVAATESWRVRE